MAKRIADLRMNYLVVLIILLSLTVNPSVQHGPYCPNGCLCDDQKKEVVCLQTLKSSGLPYTLDPLTRRMIINYANVSQLSSLDHYPELEIAHIAFNRISTIDFEIISKNAKIITLNASHNNINELKDSSVNNIPNELESQGNGQPFYLNHHKKLERINLIELILSHNQLKVIKSLTFLRFHKLQRLDLAFNYISNLENEALFGLNKLESLNLKGNRLHQVPTIAIQNAIHSLSHTFAASSLKSLDLSENSFQEIKADSFKRLKEIQELHLESSFVHSIDDHAFVDLDKLLYLSLDKNDLEEIPRNSFKTLNSLRVLKLNGNNISNLDRGLFVWHEFDKSSHEQKHLGLKSLKHLEIAFNPNLNKIAPDFLKDFPELEHLNISFNLIHTMSITNYDVLNTLKVLDLRGNPLFCDCDLKWLTNWLQNFEIATNGSSKRETTISRIDNRSNFHDIRLFSIDLQTRLELLNLRCSGPAALSGRLIIELPDNKLECLEPGSDLNVKLGYITLFLMIFIMSFVCLINLSRNRKHLFVMVKENLASNNILLMRGNEQHPYENSDDLREETQFDRRR